MKGSDVPSGDHALDAISGRICRSAWASRLITCFENQAGDKVRNRDQSKAAKLVDAVVPAMLAMITLACPGMLKKPLRDHLFVLCDEKNQFDFNILIARK